jgi:hypothetical protein
VKKHRKGLKEEQALMDWAVDMFDLDVPGVHANVVIKDDLRRLAHNIATAARKSEREYYSKLVDNALELGVLMLSIQGKERTK